MNLEAIQSYVGGLLAAHSVFASAGLVVYDPANPGAGSGIILNDGVYPKIPGREDALHRIGLSIIVDSPQFDGLDESNRVGGTKFMVAVDVLVEENVAVNRGQSRTGITAEAALRNVFLACISKPGLGGQFNIRMSDEGFSNFGVTNGVRQFMAHLTVPQLIA